MNFSNFFNLGNVSKKVARLDEIKKSLANLDSEIDSLSSDYQTRLTDYNIQKSNNTDMGLLTRIETKHALYISQYGDDISKAFSDKKKLEKEQSELSSNRKVIDYFESKANEEKKFCTMKKAFKNNLIGVEEFSKSNGGRVKYSDIMVFNENGEMLLLKRSLWEDDHQGAWVIPGGHVDPGEDFKTAAMRELVEESGFGVDTVEEVGVHKNKFVEIHYFKANVDTTKQPIILDFLETRDSRWVKMSEIQDYTMVFNMKENIMEILDIKPDNTKIIKSIKEICKAYIDGVVELDVLEKAQTKIQSDKVATVMSEFKSGKLVSGSGHKVTDRDQAIAIALSEADISKGSDDYIKDMIKEHERLVSVLEPHAKMDEKIAKELDIQKKELEKFRKKLATKAGEPLAKAYDNGIIGFDVIEKAVKDISKLTKTRKLITRGGKTYMTTVYVKTGEEVEDEKKVAEKGSDKVSGVGGELKMGDEIVASTKKKEVTGTVTGFSFHEKPKEFFVKVDSEDGGSTYVRLASLTSLKRKKASAKDSKEPAKFPSSVSELSIGVSLGGSSDVKLAEFGGESFALKEARSRDTGKGQIKEEVIADNIYTAMGLGAPESKVYEDGKYKVSKFLKGAKELGAVTITSEIKDEAKKGFVLDCLLANWDVVGANYDNMLVDDSGKIIRVDNGGSMRYRAKGGDKSHLFKDEVNEIITFRDSSTNPQTSKVFGTVTEGDIKSQVKDIVDKKELILSKATDSELKSTLKGRIEWLENNYLRKVAKKEASSGREKRSDMPSLVTQDYFDKGWDDLSIEGNDDLKESIKEHILEIEKKNESEYKGHARSRGIPVEEYKARLQKAVEKVVGESDFFIAIHSQAPGTSESVMEKIFTKGGRFKTQFETKTSKGSLSPDYRASAEHTYFGFPRSPDKNVEKRPVYGYFSGDANGVINDSGKIPPPNDVGQYGDVSVKLKKEKAISKSTVCFQDSLGNQHNLAATPASKPHFTSINSYIDPLTELESFSRSSSTNPSRYNYVEAQYHNGLSLEDVQSVHMTNRAWASRVEEAETYKRVNRAINSLYRFAAKTGHEDLEVVTF